MRNNIVYIMQRVFFLNIDAMHTHVCVLVRDLSPRFNYKPWVMEWDMVLFNGSEYIYELKHTSRMSRFCYKSRCRRTKPSKPTLHINTHMMSFHSNICRTFNADTYVVPSPQATSTNRHEVALHHIPKSKHYVLSVV